MISDRAVAEVRKSADSPLEQAGFDLSVPAAMSFVKTGYHNVAVGLQPATLNEGSVRSAHVLSTPVLRTYFCIVIKLLRTALGTPSRHDFAVRVAGSATQPECHRGESIKPV